MFNPKPSQTQDWNPQFLFILLRHSVFTEDIRFFQTRIQGSLAPNIPQPRTHLLDFAKHLRHFTRNCGGCGHECSKVMPLQGTRLFHEAPGGGASLHQHGWGLPGWFLGKHPLLHVNYEVLTGKRCLCIGIGSNVWDYKTPYSRATAKCWCFFELGQLGMSFCLMVHLPRTTRAKVKSVWYAIQRAFGRPWPSMHPKILVQALGKENCSSTTALTCIDIYWPECHTVQYQGNNKYEKNNSTAWTLAIQTGNGTSPIISSNSGVLTCSD